MGLRWKVRLTQWRCKRLTWNLPRSWKMKETTMTVLQMMKILKVSLKTWSPKMANWGVVENRDEDGSFIAYHIMPIVYEDGEAVRSDRHELSPKCHCGPFLSFGQGGWDMWNHCDPDWPGGFTLEKWIECRDKASKEVASRRALEESIDAIQ